MSPGHWSHCSMAPSSHVVPALSRCTIIFFTDYFQKHWPFILIHKLLIYIHRITFSWICLVFSEQRNALLLFLNYLGFWGLGSTWRISKGLPRNNRPQKSRTPSLCVLPFILNKEKTLPKYSGFLTKWASLSQCAVFTDLVPEASQVNIAVPTVQVKPDCAAEDRWLLRLHTALFSHSQGEWR